MSSALSDDRKYIEQFLFLSDFMLYFGCGYSAVFSFGHYTHPQIIQGPGRRIRVFIAVAAVAAASYLPRNAGNCFLQVDAERVQERAPSMQA